MSVKSFAEAVKEGKTIYNRLFGIEQAEAEEAEFAPLASPTLTGKPLAPTATALTDNTQVATTAYADSAVGVEKSRAETKEALLAPLASPALTGTPTVPEAAEGTETTQAASTSFVARAVSKASGAVSSVFGRTGAVVAKSGDYTVAEVTGAAPLASPALTGTPTVPEAAEGTETTQAASTSFVARAVSKASGAVSSVFGRTGAVVAKSGDYTVAKVTGAAPLASPALTGTPTIEGKDIPTTVEPLAISGTPTAGEVLTATSGTAADWQAGLNGETGSLYTALGEDALKDLAAQPEVERNIHTGNVGVGWGALGQMTGLIGVGAPTASTVVGSGVINLTGAEAKAEGLWHEEYEPDSNTPCIVFRKLTPGVTGLQTGVAYYVVKGTVNSFECATESEGAGVKVGGHELEAATTEIALLASTEDNVAVGHYALGGLTTGGANIGIGENAGARLTTGQENIVIGCETGDHMTTCVGNIAIGFRAAHTATTAEGVVAIGYDALELGTGNFNVTVGQISMLATTTGEKGTALGHESLLRQTTGDGNTAVGFQTLTEVTAASLNVAVGAYAAAVATGGENTAIGVASLIKLKAGEGNCALGIEAGNKITGGSKNLCLGYEAGPAAEGEVSNKLYIHNAPSATPLIGGTFPNAELQLNAAKLGFNKKAPVSLIAESLSTGSLGTPTLTSPYGFATKAEAEAAFKFIEKWSLFMHEAGLTA